MATRKKKKHKFVDTLTCLYDKYWKPGTVFVACITKYVKVGNKTYLE